MSSTMPLELQAMMTVPVQVRGVISRTGFGKETTGADRQIMVYGVEGFGVYVNLEGVKVGASHTLYTADDAVKDDDTIVYLGEAYKIGRIVTYRDETGSVWGQEINLV